MMLGLGVPPARRSPPVWLLPAGPAVQFNFAERSAWANRRAYFDEASIIALCSTFTTPPHIATGADGTLYPVASGRLDCFAMPQGACAGQLDEPIRANKQANYNAYPTDLTGVMKGGAAAATLTVVDDTAALLAAGLFGICASGKVYKLDNSAGLSQAWATIDGQAGNTNLHQFSAYVRCGQGTGQLNRNGTGAGSINYTNAAYQRKSISIAPAGATNTFNVEVQAGGIVYFILNQLEEGASVTSPIIVAGASATRVASDIRIPLPAKFTLAGMSLFMKFRLGDDAATSNAAPRLASLYADASNHWDVLCDNGAAYAGIPGVRALSGGTQYVNTPSVADAIAIGDTGFHKIAAAFANNDLAFSADGHALRTVAVAPAPVVTPNELRLGFFGVTGPNHPLYIRTVGAFASRLNNAQLQGLAA